MIRKITNWMGNHPVLTMIAAFMIFTAVIIIFSTPLPTGPGWLDMGGGAVMLDSGSPEAMHTALDSFVEHQATLVQ